MKMAKIGVYQWRNLINGKVYVGSGSKSISARKMGHLYALQKGTHPNRYLQNAWNKYGEENFVFEIIEECISENAIAREQYWIDTKQAANPEFGYNLSPTAGSPLGCKRSDEAKANYVEAFAREETKRLRSERSKAAWNRPGARERRRAAMKLAHNKLEVIQRHAHAMSPEAKKRMVEKCREAAKRIWANPERKAKAKEIQSHPEVIAAKKAAVQRRTARNGTSPNHPERKKKIKPKPLFNSVETKASNHCSNEPMMKLGNFWLVRIGTIES